jgi:DNA-binding NtrC family response regulator
VYRELPPPTTLVELRVPPLGQRKNEIEPLVRRSLAALAAETERKVPDISTAALSLLLNYDWPGNVRELHNVVERAMVLCIGDTITPEHLPLDKLAPAESAPPPASASLGDFIPTATEDAEWERQQILDALARCAGNQTRAAKMLGTSRFALMRRLKELEIPRPRAGRSTTLIQ